MTLRQFLSILICAALTVSYAELRYHRPSSSQSFLPSDAQRLYSSSASVNGVDGVISVYSVQEELPDGSFTKVATTPCPIWRLNIPGDRGNAVLILETATEPTQGSPQWLFSDISEPSGSQLSICASVSDGRAQACIGTAIGTPESVLSQLRSSLSLAGWTLLTPDGFSALIFAKDSSLFLVSTSVSTTGSTVYCALHRRVN